MMYDLARAERQHRAINKDNPTGPAAGFHGMRTCTGTCKRRRSLMQFKAGSTVCQRCTRRAR